MLVCWWVVAIWRWLVGLLVAIWLVCWCSRDLQADLIGATAAAGGRGGGDLIRALEGGKEGEKGEGGGDHSGRRRWRGKRRQMKEDEEEKLSNHSIRSRKRLRRRRIKRGR